MAMSRSRVGYLLMLLAPLLAAVACYAAWRAGCLFDAKSGVGDYVASGPWSISALVVMALGLVSLIAGFVLVVRGSAAVILGSALFFGILFVPLAVLALAAAEASGTRSCGVE